MFKYDSDCVGQTPYTVYDSKLDWYSMSVIPISLEWQVCHFPILQILQILHVEYLWNIHACLTD